MTGLGLGLGGFGTKGLGLGLDNRSPLNKSAIYKPLNLLVNKTTAIYLAGSIFDVCVSSTSNMEEEKNNAGKYLSEILENDECTFEILLNQWRKRIDKKLLFRFTLWSLR